jgi:ribosomal protein S18 acetylase RimI-like enzyme
MSLTTQHGESFQVRAYRTEDYPYLVAMYDAFSPKGAFQGMPPIVEEVRYRWIGNLLKGGHNFLAWQEGFVIGHVVILPDFKISDAEYLIFVGTASQGKGVGKALTHTAIAKARELGLKKVWLTVDSYNFRGIKLYQKSGFKIRKEAFSLTERVMELDLGAP